ncbi:hypothetical protein [Gordonia westfalica]|uniref:hypothetical protein n=1 Tax=Gordonia westfalica TaxID=158898 RepID=UPI0011135F59|nr:hypothetical protein [Gordonia westfalica]
MRITNRTATKPAIENAVDDRRNVRRRRMSQQPDHINRLTHMLKLRIELVVRVVIPERLIRIRELRQA